MNWFKLLGLKNKGLGFLVELIRQFGRDGVKREFEKIFKRMSPKGREELAADLVSLSKFVKLGNHSDAAGMVVEVIFEDIKL